MDIQDRVDQSWNNNRRWAQVEKEEGISPWQIVCEVQGLYPRTLSNESLSIEAWTFRVSVVNVISD